MRTFWHPAFRLLSVFLLGELAGVIGCFRSRCLASDRAAGLDCIVSSLTTSGYMPGYTQHGSAEAPGCVSTTLVRS